MIFYGILIYLIKVLIFCLIYYCTNGISNDYEKADLFDCIYFSLITMATIGYGDLLPTNSISKIFIFLQTIISFILTPLFGSYLFYIFQKRISFILLPDDLVFITSQNGEYSFFIIVTNLGDVSIQNELNIEFGDRHSEIFNVQNIITIKKPILETNNTFVASDQTILTWFFERYLKSNTNCTIRISISGIDNVSGQQFYAFKEYQKVKIVRAIAA